MSYYLISVRKFYGFYLERPFKVCVKFSGGLRNIPGVENYSVALTNVHGGTLHSVANLAALGCVRFVFVTFLTRKIWLFERTHKNA